MISNHINFIYKTTNLINQKYYYDKHCTNNIDDGYLGQGVALLKAIKKYGKHNFKKEIICFANTLNELDALEKQITTEEIIKDELCYNLTIGGTGGPTFKNKRHSDVTKNKISKSLLQRREEVISQSS